MASTPTIRFTLPGREVDPVASRARGPRSRGTTPGALADDVTVRMHFDVSRQRAAVGRASTPPLAADDVVAVELDGGFVLYTSAGRLADDLRRIGAPVAPDGSIPLDALERSAPATRGLGDCIVRALSVLGVDDGDLAVRAAEKLKELGTDALVKGASWAGTKALTWAIEEQLKPGPGLYRWSEDDGGDGDLLAPEPVDAGSVPAGGEMLVFVHGTASSTAGSFSELRRATAQHEWLALRARFGEHIYGFEHRTFSQSPIDNALELATALPRGTRLSLVTHSRGGLVGDLLAASDLARFIDGFDRHDPLLARADEHDRARLRELVAMLQQKALDVQRYVRVACPAQGTLLASSHLDAFLSALLHLIGMVPVLAASPVYAVVQRIVLQIVKNRTDPRFIPGIEAMLPSSPLAALVGRADARDTAQIAVVAGDIEGGGVLKRIGVFLTDQLLFERKLNDLVVDTESMLGGVARATGRYVFDQGEDVSHFRYFANARTRRALEEWLTSDGDPAASGEFQPIRVDEALQPMQRGLETASGEQPVVILLPGMLGSHLQVDGQRIWFDFLQLVLGHLPKLAFGTNAVAPDGIFRLFYGALHDHLLTSADVVTFAYDWRCSLDDAADALATVLDAALDKTEPHRQPVRLLAHSMGGLVVRMMIARHPQTWKRVVAHPGGRFVMLGTPNRGSHAAVEALLGLSSTVRKLAMLEPLLGVQGVVDLMAGFPGSIQMLPAPGFRDTAGTTVDWFDDALWPQLKQGNDSFWFGHDLGAVPTAKILADGRDVWSRLEAKELPDVDRIAYVAGTAQETPCGLERDADGHVHMLGTLNGDGTVTHDSGLLDVLRRNRRVWFMDADHAGLAATPDEFPALVELLEHGETSLLSQTPPAVRDVERTFRYEPGPVLYPTEQDLARLALGGRRPPERVARPKRTLQVSCRAMDLRHAIDPILVGHYDGDAIAGAEAQIDRHLMANRLTVRHHLDGYAGPTGTVAIVVDEPNPQTGVRRGAVVVGLGDLGDLSAGDLAAAVRQGAVRYLLQLFDRANGGAVSGTVGLTSLLVGYNSTTHIGIDDSVGIVVRAVLEANRQFADVSGSSICIERLEFVELFEDVAISAAKAVRDAVQRLRGDAARLGFRLEAAPELICGEGMRQRLEATPHAFGYWPRLIVARGDDEAATPPAEDGTAAPLPDELRYTFLSMRARAESVEQQRQPDLVERLVQTNMVVARHQPDVARTLFNVLVPTEFKETARRTENLVLVVDQYTANLPWEMLVADDQPLIATTAVVRQFVDERFRHVVRQARGRRAYVLGNPSTDGFYAKFPSGDGASTERKALPDLPGAAAEARLVTELLSGESYQVTEVPTGAEAADVLSKLYAAPYRIVHIAAHGAFGIGEGKQRRSGVVLSDGLFLTAAEIGALDAVPDLVFLNCCHSGRIDAQAPEVPGRAYNRLAHSVARELIRDGVRAVIVAGWAVNDEAARCFAKRFYEAFLHEHKPFGRAVHEARLATYQQYPEWNTWGAFQAYGEPSFVMEPESLPAGARDDFHPVATQELIARIDEMRNELAHATPRRGGDARVLTRTVDRLLRQSVSPSWPLDPGVLYALGRLYGDAGDFERARDAYARAIACEDRRGSVPIVAIEQLGNMEVRDGAQRIRAGNHDEGRALVDRGLGRLEALGRVAGGVDAKDGGPINAERCALLGGAYKRLAAALVTLPAGARDADVLAALTASRDWYARGQGDPDAADFSPYDAQNRIALDAVLGVAKPEDAALARRAGTVASARYACSRDYFDRIMLADGELVAALVEGGLDGPDADRVEGAVIAAYHGVLDGLPETIRGRDSVVSQLEVLATFFARRAVVGGGTSRVAERLRSIVAALQGTADAGGRAPGGRPVTPAAAQPARPLDAIRFGRPADGDTTAAPPPAPAERLNGGGKEAPDA